MKRAPSTKQNMKKLLEKIMQHNLSKVIEEQSEIITAQAETINRLSQILLQYISAEELEKLIKLNNKQSLRAWYQ